LTQSVPVEAQFGQEAVGPTGGAGGGGAAGGGAGGGGAAGGGAGGDGAGPSAASSPWICWTS